MTNPVFTGVATALVTPLDANGVNWNQYERLINWQIDEGVDALVIAATTGEGSTLSDEEHRECIRFAVEKANGRVPIIAGTGSNDTAYGVALTQAACEMGADACLVVTPYYNKVTQSGLIRMYAEYAAASTKPIIMYNVPSRTGVNIEPATYAELAKIDGIEAIKEANNDIAKITETMSMVSGDLTLYSGNDDQIVPLMALGSQGVISVLSNVVPRQTHDMVMKYIEGDLEGAMALQFKYMDLVKSLFCEVNPIPVKAAVAAMGYCENYVRAPLYPLEGANLERLMTSMRNVGLVD